MTWQPKVSPVETNGRKSFVQDGVARYCLPLESAVASNRCERIFFAVKVKRGKWRTAQRRGVRQIVEQVASPFPFLELSHRRAGRRSVPEGTRLTPSPIASSSSIDPVHTADGGVGVRPAAPFPSRPARPQPTSTTTGIPKTTHPSHSHQGSRSI